MHVSRVCACACALAGQWFLLKRDFAAQRRVCVCACVCCVCASVCVHVDVYVCER